MAGRVHAAAALVVRVGAVLAVVGAVGQAVAHLVDALVLDFRVEMLNADDEGGVPAWAGATAAFAAATGTALLAALVPARRVALALLAVLLAVLSLDDGAALHERIDIGAIGPFEEGKRLLWPLVLLPLLALVFVMLAALAEAAPAVVRRVLRLSLVMLVVAVMFEAGSALLFELGSDSGELLYETEVAVEEGLELAAWLLAAGALTGGALLVAATPRDGGGA